jgi:hypothetical protein
MRRWDCVKDEDLAFLSLEEIKGVLNHLYQGVWIRTDDKSGRGLTGHPCGWDFVNLAEVLEDDENTLWCDDISNGCYYDSEYEDMTLKEFLGTIRCFWVNGIPEESFVADNKYAYAWNGK